MQILQNNKAIKSPLTFSAFEITLSLLERSLRSRGLKFAQNDIVCDGVTWLGHKQCHFSAENIDEGGIGNRFD